MIPDELKKSLHSINLLTDIPKTCNDKVCISSLIFSSNFCTVIVPSPFVPPAPFNLSTLSSIHTSSLGCILTHHGKLLPFNFNTIAFLLHMFLVYFPCAYILPCRVFFSNRLISTNRGNYSNTTTKASLL